MDWSTIQGKLKEPFRPDEIEWRVGSTNGDKTKGLALAYVTNRAIQDRLDDVFGPSNWQNEFRPWKSDSQICGISVWDDDKQQWITKWDGADDSQTEAIKGGLSDSMKRSAYQWGIGRYLYKLPQTWVAIEACGKSYRLKETPKLPLWALPKDYKTDCKQTTSEQSNPAEEYQAEDLNTSPAPVPEKHLCKACGKDTPAKVFNYHNLGLCYKCQQDLKNK